MQFDAQHMFFHIARYIIQDARILSDRQNPQLYSEMYMCTGPGDYCNTKLWYLPIAWCLLQFITVQHSFDHAGRYIIQNTRILRRNPQTQNHTKKIRLYKMPSKCGWINCTLLHIGINCHCCESNLVLVFMLARTNEDTQTRWKSNMSPGSLFYTAIVVLNSRHNLLCESHLIHGYFIISQSTLARDLNQCYCS